MSLQSLKARSAVVLNTQSSAIPVGYARMVSFASKRDEQGRRVIAGRVTIPLAQALEKFEALVTQVDAGGEVVVNEKPFGYAILYPWTTPGKSVGYIDRHGKVEIDSDRLVALLTDITPKTPRKRRARG
jgi:hypothetical protein